MSKPEPQTVALFRYGLIAELVHLPLGSPGLYAKLREKASQSYTIPGSTRRFRTSPQCEAPSILT